MNFLQLGIKNLIGTNKQFAFASSPFNLLVKQNPNLLVDSSYKKNKVLRRINFDFSVALDKDYKFSGFSSGVKYALINQRDITTSRYYTELLKTDTVRQAVSKLFVAYNKAIGNIDNREELFNSGMNFFSYHKIAFNELDSSSKNIINNILATTKDSSIKKLANLLNDNPEQKLDGLILSGVEKMRNYMKARPLWTVGITDTTYQDRLMFSNILLFTEFSKGIGKPKKGSNWELNLYAGLNFSDDSLSIKKDLARTVFRFSPGVNLVVRDAKNQYSFIEFRFGGLYSHVFNSLYPGEKRDLLELNGIIRVRILRDFWVPLEIRYDPAYGRFLGFLDVRFNFTDFAK